MVDSPVPYCALLVGGWWLHCAATGSVCPAWLWLKPKGYSCMAPHGCCRASLGHARQQQPPHIAITQPALRAHCQLYDLRGVPAQQHHQQRHSHPALWGMQALPAVSSTRRQAGTRTGGFHTLPRLLSRPLTVRQPPEARTAEPQRRAPTACARCGGALSLGLCPFVFCRGSQAALDRSHRSDR